MERKLWWVEKKKRFKLGYKISSLYNVWTLAKHHGDIRKAIYIGEKCKRYTLWIQFCFYPIISAIMCFYVFDNINYMNLTEEKKKHV